MLCQECRRNEANIHIVKNIEGKQSELNLCEQCARKKEELDFSFEPQFSLHKLFAAMLDQKSLQGKRSKAGDSSLQCPSCSLSFAQFSQIGRLGCSECFSAFSDRLQPLLRKIHGSCNHTGKVPSRLRTKVNLLREIDQLKEELQQKVENEEFEEAALLRDRIKAMEGTMQQDEKEKGDSQ